jgi:two-component system, OmpR family, response regulator ChvI
LSKFTPGLYDLDLFDVRMPKMNGFELYREIEKIDHNLKVCFVTAFVVYYESLKEIFPMAKVSCFIKKTNRHRIQTELRLMLAVIWIIPKW